MSYIPKTKLAELSEILVKTIRLLDLLTLIILT